MTVYCTNCNYLEKRKTKNYSYWKCCMPNAIVPRLNMLQGNPLKSPFCIKGNWHEVKIKQQEKKMKTKELVEIGQAYLDGKKIQWKDISCGNIWKDCNGEPTWHPELEWRIKPEPKYRPLKPEELIELKGKWLRYKKDENYELVTRVDVVFNRIYTSGTGRDAEELLRCWTHEDGSPVGKLED